MAKQRTARKPDIRVENSAPSQRLSAFSVRWSAPILAKEGVRRVADIGSGTLRNLRVQENHFDEIALVETVKACEKLRDKVVGKNHVLLQSTKEFQASHTKYDAAFLIAVLHIIPDDGYRRFLVRMAKEKLRPGGFIIVDVPQSETYYNRRRNSMLRYRDGFLLRWGGHYTFYKSFYAAELDKFFLDSGLQLFAKTHYSKHLIRIWRRPK